MSIETSELRHRVEARRKELEAEIERRKADSAESASEAITKLRKHIDDLDDAVRNGWENMTDATVARINDLLRKD